MNEFECRNTAATAYGCLGAFFCESDSFFHSTNTVNRAEGRNYLRLCVSVIEPVHISKASS